MEKNKNDKRMERRRRRLRERVISILTVVCMLAGVFAGTLPASVFADDNIGWLIGGYSDSSKQKADKNTFSVSVLNEQSEATTSQEKISYNTEISGGTEPYTVQYEMYVNDVLKDTLSEYSQVVYETPSEPGDYTLVMKATDANGETAEASATIHVTGEGAETEAVKVEPHIEITADQVNVRAEASVDSDIIGTVEMGTTLSLMGTITTEDGSIWYQVKLDGVIGYVRGDLAQAFEAETESEAESESESETETESETEVTETTLSYKGSDYTVEVTYGPESGIPSDAELKVKEIKEGTAAYDSYLQKSVEALVDNKPEVNSEEELEVTFARYFDITFLVEGEETEPSAPVDVKIVYDDAIAVDQEANVDAVHFVENSNEIEVLDTQTEESRTGVEEIAFTQESFSVTGTVVSIPTKDYNLTSGTYAICVANYHIGHPDKGGSSSLRGLSYYALGRGNSTPISTPIPVVYSNGKIYYNGNKEDISWTYTASGNHGSFSYIKDTKTYYLSLVGSWAVAELSTSNVSHPNFYWSKGENYQNRDRLLWEVGPFSTKYYLDFNNSPNSLPENLKFVSTNSYQPRNYYEPMVVMVKFDDIETVSANDFTINDRIKERGRIEPSYNGNDDNCTYVWQKSTDSGRTWQDVVRKRVLGTECNVAEDGSWLNVELDDGALPKTENIVGKNRYRVQLRNADSNDIVTSEEYIVPYWGEVRNGSFETPENMYNFNEQVGNAQYAANGGVWQTTGNDGAMEIVSVKGNYVNTTWRAFNTKTAAAGDQFAELNCEADGTLYQDILTSPGETLYWSLYHRARGWDNLKGDDEQSGEDTMYVIAMPTSEAEKINDGDDIQKVLKNPGNYNATIETISDDNHKWYYHWGSYTIPEGQYLTRFFFAAGPTLTNNKTIGNLLDDIHFSKERYPEKGTSTITLNKTITGLTEADFDKLKYKIKFKVEYQDHNNQTQSIVLKGTDCNWENVNGVYKMSKSWKIEGYTLDTEERTVTIEEVEGTIDLDNYKRNTELKVTKVDSSSTTSEESQTVYRYRGSLKEKESLTANFTNMYEIPTDEDTTFITVDKTFSGIATVPDGFKIIVWKEDEDKNKTKVAELSTTDQNLVITPNTDGSFTYKWQVDRLGDGTYYIEEKGADVDSYVRTTTVDGGTIVENSNNPEFKVQIQVPTLKLDGTVDTINRNNNSVIKLAGANFIAATINEKGANGTSYFIWTEAPLSAGERKAIKEFLSKVDKNGAGNFNSIESSNSVHFFSTGGRLEQGINFGYGQIKWNKSDDVLSFTHTSSWQHVIKGKYVKNEGVSADISINNSYEPITYDLKVEKKWIDASGNPQSADVHTSDQVYVALYKSATNNDTTTETFVPDSITVLNVSNNWTHTYSGLKIVDGPYVVRELAPSTNTTDDTIEDSSGKSFVKKGAAELIQFNGNDYEISYQDVSQADIVKEAGKTYTASVTNTLKTSDIEITKTDSADGSKQLSGAVFKIQKKAENDEYADLYDSNNNLISVTTDGNGKAKFTNLENGTYKIVETKAPEGYSLKADGIEVVVSYNNKNLDGISIYSIPVTNTKLYALPSTGGIGTYWFTISGVAILMTALLLFIKNKRKGGLGIS